MLENSANCGYLPPLWIRYQPRRKTVCRAPKFIIIYTAAHDITRTYLSLFYRPLTSLSTSHGSSQFILFSFSINLQLQVCKLSGPRSSYTIAQKTSFSSMNRYNYIRWQIPRLVVGVLVLVHVPFARLYRFDITSAFLQPSVYLSLIHI